MEVPQFKSYFASEESMNGTQRAFFHSWRKAWTKGNPIDIDGQASYVFCYMYEVLSWAPARAISELQKLKEAYYEEDDTLVFYCDKWSSDFYVTMGDYDSAIDVFPVIQLDSISGANTDDLLSLKLEMDRPVSGRDLITLRGAKVTVWGKKNLSDVSDYLDILVRSYETNEGVNLLREWVRTCHQYVYCTFRGSFKSGESQLKFYHFSGNPIVVDFAAEYVRKAENTIRNERGIPKVGEAWVSETSLYYEIRTCLPNIEVIHHVRLPWLGRQHLDVFVPSKHVAVEYQGLQHDQPVEYFGGEEAFVRARKRDLRKQRLCRKNGIRLIYVRPGYKLQDVIKEIVMDWA